MSSPDPSYKPRNLILCFDGSGDSFDADNTNIVRLFTALDKTRTDKQLCYYQPGIGTYVPQGGAAGSTIATGFNKFIDFAIAVYLDAHIQGGYRWLMENYTKGDKLTIFGFSRGAYTARCLAGMLHKVGLLPKGNVEQIPFAYAKYTDESTTGKIEAQGFKDAFSINVDIDFMGCWDTVSSVGIISAKHLPFSSSNSIIRVFRHALSLDEHRARFQPNPWHRDVDNAALANADPDGGTAVAQDGYVNPINDNDDVTDGLSGRARAVLNKADKNGENNQIQFENVYHHGKVTDVREVWFAGCHTDVGGGSEANLAPNTLANPSLQWMVSEVISAGTPIIFKDDAFGDVQAFAVVETSTPPADSRRDATESTVIVSAADQGSSKNYGSFSKPLINGHGPQATDGSNIESVIDMQMGLDAKAALHDNLETMKKMYWWLLEFLPMKSSWQKPNGEWKSKWYLHLGRPRTIQEPNPLFHSSVKIREAGDPTYKPRARYQGEPQYVDY